MKTIPHTRSTKAVAASALALLLALPVHAATFTLNPSADAFVTTGPSGNFSANNYGGAGALSVAASGLAQGEFQSVMRFELAAARTSFDTQFGAGQWNVQSITLSLTAASPGNSIFNPSAAGQLGIAWMQNDSWIEGTGKPTVPTTIGITYAGLPAYTSTGDESLGTFSFAGGTSGSGTYTLGLSPGLVAEASAGNLVSLRLFPADSAVSYLCYSGNNTGSRPLLSVVAVPEPQAFSLLVTGAIFLCRAGYRRRSQQGCPASPTDSFSPPCCGMDDRAGDGRSNPCRGDTAHWDAYGELSPVPGSVRLAKVRRFAG